MRRAKIVCTIGPATASAEQIQALVDAGMDVARINRSHGTAEEHEEVVERVRRAAQNSGRGVAVLVDLQGPKIRLETFEEGPQYLEIGDTFTITTRDVPGTKELVGTTFKGLPGDCAPGDRLLIDDGNVAVRVVEVTDTDVVTRVEVPGYVSDHKGLNLPGVAVSVPAMSAKDEEDLRWGIKIDADFIALSFVRSASDIDSVHAIMDECGKRLPVIAKIEKPQAVEALSEIVDAFDGIMVARGDLGVEVPAEDVPVIQKEIIRKCNAVGKPVIVATQMLESMTENPRPTRAEVSDVGNAIFDGADAIMLSGETASGNYPVEAVKMMNTIAQRCEASLEYDSLIRSRQIRERSSTTDAVSHATVQLAYETSATAILTPTQSGYTTRVVSKYRPKATIVAYAPSPMVARHINLRWGVYSIQGRKWSSVEEMIESCTKSALDNGYVDHGDKVVMVAGMTYNEGGSIAVRVTTIH